MRNDSIKKTVNLAVAGVGLAGMQHLAAIRKAEDIRLAAVADPADNGKTAAQRENVPHFNSLGEMLRGVQPDGVVVATPTPLHAEHGAACVRAGVPALMEKPLAHDSAAGAALAAAAKAKGVPLLTGHHRRHNPLVAAARKIIDDGKLGQLTIVNAQAWLAKPDDYFRPQWRREKGAGPVFTNMTHDLDLLRHLCGEIQSVRAAESGAVRGNPVEDAAVALLTFANGALGTISACDAAVAPWSWELTARENPAYPSTCESCYWLAGTRGALSLPNLSLWQNPGAHGWRAPVACVKPVFDFGEDSMLRQIRHFADVIRGDAQPLVSAEDGLRTLAAAEAVKQSALSGKRVQLAAD